MENDEGERLTNRSRAERLSWNREPRTCRDAVRVEHLREYRCLIFLNGAREQVIENLGSRWMKTSGGREFFADENRDDRRSRQRIEGRMRVRLR